MPKLKWTTTLALVAVALAGCPGGDMNGADGGDSGGSDVVRTDAPREASADTGGGNEASVDVPIGTDAARDGGADAGTLFGQCAVDADCGGAMGTACLTAWPGGLCTKQCSTDRACGTGGICFQNICIPRCTPTQTDSDGGVTPGGGECVGHGTVCFQVDQLDTTRGACFPSCNSPMDPGVPNCPTGTQCDLYSGNCTDPTMFSTGDDNGAPCMSDSTGMSNCKGGRCIDELNMDGTANGFIGGYCFSVGIQLPLDSYTSDMDIPRSNCPMGSVVLPDDPTNTPPGDPAICWKDCHANSDCRAGYECFEFPQPDAGNFFTSGACLPIDCNDDTWRPMANHGCPVTHFCDVDATTMRGTCTPNSLAPDGGVTDAGSPVDSGSTDAGSPVDSGSTDTDAGSPVDSGVQFLSLTACPAQTDYTNTPTTVSFGGSLGTNYAPKCLEVNSGASVTFAGDFTMHPLLGDTPQGGPTLNPITPTALGTTASFTFTTPGFYLYHCTAHGQASGTGMAGVIWVKP